ncbi:EAL domain-containing protein [Haploplasma modicum]|uniref:EAL domain-containing protein n=1 Tax=Haploplasma modicum TaxID=2150 RepID=UPI00047EEC15|nr:EAL domain-containing protein [Haploplasma modicum]
MTLNDILVLNNDLSNLDLIMEYLDTSLPVVDYERAVLKFLDIAIFNEQYEFALKHTSNLMQNILDKKPGKTKEKIYFKLFNIALKLEKFNVAYDFLVKRQEILPEMDKYLSLLDEYEYYKALGDDTLDILLKLKHDIIPKDILVYVKEEILKYYTDKLDFEKAIIINNELIDDTLNIKYENNLVKLFYLKKDFEKAIEVSKKLEEENNIDLKTIIYYIASLRELKQYKLAVTVETTYEISFDNSSDSDLKTFAYKEIIKLYDALNNKYSKDLYQAKLDKITPKEKEIVKKTEKPIKEVVKIKEITTNRLISSAKYLEHFSFLKEWNIFSHNLDLNLKFREYLRLLFIEINKKFEFLDVIVYLNNSFDSNLFNYKKGRLYDKKILRHVLDDTIISETIAEGHDIFINPENLIKNKNILTNKEYDDEVKFIYSFYINQDFVVLFHLDEEITDQGVYYELLSGITNIIYLRILDLGSNTRLKNESNYLNNVFNNKIMPMRILNETRSKYNVNAINLFNIEENLYLELFMREMDLEDAKNYEKVINRLFNYPNETNIVTYKYQDIYIKEYLFAVNEENKVSVVSFFTDVTSVLLNEEDLKNKVILDNETTLFNKNQLILDFNEHIKDKATFVLVELDFSAKEIYGSERMNKFFIEFSHATKKHFSEKVYRYDHNQLLIILEYNDIRTVTNTVNQYLQVVNHLKSVILKYEKFKVFISFLRYPVASNDKNHDKIFRYLDVSLANAKNTNTDFVDFSHSLYENEVYEQQVIDYLNLAIENKELSVNFKQIIDTNDNLVVLYESELSLPQINTENNYLKLIAKKRNKLIELEYFHIEYIASFLNKMKKETNHLINILVPISKETFLDNLFESNLITIYKKNNINFESIRLLINDEIKSAKDILKIQSLNKLGFKLETTNVTSVLHENFSKVHLDLQKNSKKIKLYYQTINEFLNNFNIKLVIRNVNTVEDKEFINSLGINYIEGKLYKTISPDVILKQIKEKL